MTRQADILVVAAGCRGLIRGDMVKDGAVVIDVAMNRDPETGKFSGDVLFEEVEPKVSFITPVPGRPDDAGNADEKCTAAGKNPHGFERQLKEREEQNESF